VNSQDELTPVVSHGDGKPQKTRGSKMKKISVVIEDEQGEKSVTETGVEKPLHEIYMLIGRFIEGLKSPCSPSIDALFSIHDEDVLARSSDPLVKRFKRCVIYEFSDRWFTSKEVKWKFDRDNEGKIKMSTVSTYLLRLCKENILERRGARNNREYRVLSPGEGSPASSDSNTNILISTKANRR
jgi:hypothetical protein